MNPSCSEDMPGCEELATLRERTRNLEAWQKAQNGMLQHISDKVDRLQYWIMGALAAVLGGTLVNVLMRR